MKPLNGFSEAFLINVLQCNSVTIAEVIGIQYSYVDLEHFFIVAYIIMNS